METPETYHIESRTMQKKSTLFELTDKLLWVEELLEQSEEELQERYPQEDFLARLEKFLDGTEEARNDKLDAYAWLITRYEQEERVAREIAAEWEDKARTRKRRVDALKSTLMQHLQIMRQKKVETGQWRFSVVKNSQAPLRVNKQDLPVEFLIPQEPKADMVAIRRAIKSQGEVSGVEVLPENYHLRIK